MYFLLSVENHDDNESPDWREMGSSSLIPNSSTLNNDIQDDVEKTSLRTDAIDANRADETVSGHKKLTIPSIRPRRSFDDDHVSNLNRVQSSRIDSRKQSISKECSKAPVSPRAFNARDLSTSPASINFDKVSQNRLNQMISQQVEAAIKKAQVIPCGTLCDSSEGVKAIIPRASSTRKPVDSDDSNSDANPFDSINLTPPRVAKKRRAEDTVEDYELLSADRHHKKSRPSGVDLTLNPNEYYSPQRDGDQSVRTTTTISRGLLQSSSRSSNAIGSAPMPAFILDQLPHPERSLLSRRLKASNLDIHTCPSNIFARYYLKYGTNDGVRRYCQFELERNMAADQLLEVKKGSASRSLSPEYDSDKERRERKGRVEREKFRRNAWHTNEPWNQIIPSNKLDNTVLRKIFPEIDETVAKHLLKDVPAFDPTSDDTARSDWCTWYDSIKSNLAIHERYRAIFILIIKAGAKYTTEFIAGVNFGLREMPLEIVMRRLGAIVYNKLGINTLKLSTSKLRMRTYGITSYRDLYTRVVDLYHCRWDTVDEAKFVQEIFHGIAFKMPKGDRQSYYATVYARYPSLKTAEYSDKGSQYYSSSTPDYLPYTKPYPHGAKEISEFEEFLIQTASELTPQKIELNYAYLCSDSDHRMFGTISRPAVKFAAGTKNGNEDKSASNEGQGKGGQHQVKQVAANIATSSKAQMSPPPNKSPPSSARPVCSHCDKLGHAVETCFVLHPELKEEYLAKSKARRQERKNAAVKSDSAAENKGASAASKNSKDKATKKPDSKKNKKGKASTAANNSAVTTSSTPSPIESSSSKDESEVDSAQSYFDQDF